MNGMKIGCACARLYDKTTQQKNRSTFKWLPVIIKSEIMGRGVCNTWLHDHVTISHG